MFKIMGLTGLMMMLAVSAFADAPEADQIQLVEKFHCLLNKSESIIVSFDERAGNVSKVQLELRNFLGDSGGRPIVFQRPAMHFIDYGNVIMVSQNFGRSGYAFLRIEKTSESLYEGWIDINAFLASTGMQTGGHLLNLPCYKSVN